MGDQLEMKFDELLDQATFLPNGPAKIGVLEEAIRLADTHLSIKERFDARMELVYTCIFAGHGHKAIVAFAWCLAQYDQDPERSSDYNMMWNYKWVADRLLSFPDISIVQVNEALADMKQRFISLGYSPAYYDCLKMYQAMMLEKSDQAATYYEQWIQQPSDAMSDCRACTLAAQAEALLFLGRFTEAVEVAEPIFDGRRTCHSVPHRTYADFLYPLLVQNELDTAAEYHRKGYELIQGEPDMMESATKHLIYLTVIDSDRAISCLETFLPSIVETSETKVKYGFFLAASILLDELGERAEGAIHFPAGQTATSIKRQLAELATQFDRQNETNVFTRKVKRFSEEVSALKQRITKG